MRTKPKFRFPNDTFTVGKYKGKELKFIIDNDLKYFNWMIAQDFEISDLIKRYAKGENVVQTKLTSVFIRKSGELQIRLHEFYLLPKVKFVQGKDKIREISKRIITPYRCPFECATEVVERTKSCYGNGMQSDDIHWVEKYNETVYSYPQPDLQNWIDEKMLLHQDELSL